MLAASSSAATDAIKGWAARPCRGDRRPHAKCIADELRRAPQGADVLVALDRAARPLPRRLPDPERNGRAEPPKGTKKTRPLRRARRRGRRPRVQGRQQRRRRRDLLLALLLEGLRAQAPCWISIAFPRPGQRHGNLARQAAHLPSLPATGPLTAPRRKTAPDAGIARSSASTRHHASRSGRSTARTGCAWVGRRRALLWDLARQPFTGFGPRRVA